MTAQSDSMSTRIELLDSRSGNALGLAPDGFAGSASLRRLVGEWPAMGRRRDASGITMSLTMASTADASFSIDSVGGPREFRGLARRIGPFDCSNLKRLRSRSASKQCAVSQADRLSHNGDTDLGRSARFQSSAGRRAARRRINAVLGGQAGRAGSITEPDLMVASAARISMINCATTNVRRRSLAPTGIPLRRPVRSARWRARC